MPLHAPFKMKIVSKIYDGLLKAHSLLFEMSVSEYLTLGKHVLTSNKYQRRRVQNAPTMYGLLGHDLLHLCTMPPIVLSFKEGVEAQELLNETSEDVLHRLMDPKYLLILDGLQRTYTMLEVLEKLTISPEEKDAYLQHTIRVEVYVGLNNTGILYRMLTLNSGQTPMSKRHQIEILYSSYKNNNLDGIQFVCQTDTDKRQGLNSYDFDDAIEGFNSFINADESPIDKIEIREIVQRLEKITNDDYEKNVFEDFMRTYNKFVLRIDELTNSWTYQELDKGKKMSIYGRDIPHFFSKSQTISAFGAAIGFLFESKKLKSLEEINQSIDNIEIGNAADQCFNVLLMNLDEIRQRAPKIGVEQRYYLRMFFAQLFSVDSETCMNVYGSAEKSFQLYKDKKWKQDTTEEPSLF